jgi:hypothetical protein
MAMKPEAVSLVGSDRCFALRNPSIKREGIQVTAKDGIADLVAGFPTCKICVSVRPVGLDFEPEGPQCPVDSRFRHAANLPHPPWQSIPNL